MARRGLINCHIDGRGQHAPYQTPVSPIGSEMYGAHGSYMSNEMFVTLFNFFSSATAQSLGIQRRAYFQGGQSQNLCYPMLEFMTASQWAGTGTGYWDQANPMGNHAWAAFEFTLGSPSFWIFMQWGATTGATGGGSGEQGYFTSQAFGLSGSGGQASGSLGNPYASDASNIGGHTALTVAGHTRLAGCGISVAFMNDGSSPWNGTINNNGADTKGAPLWKASAMAFPRANNDRGMFASSKDLLFGLMYEGNSCFVTTRVSSPGSGQPQLFMTSLGMSKYVPTYDNSDVLYHTIIEEDKLCILIDHSGIGCYSMFYYGPYVPYSSGSIAPRIALHKYLNNNDAAGVLSLGNNQVYGGFDMGLINASNQFSDQTMGDYAYHQGGVTHPMSASVVGCSLDTFPNSYFDSPRRFQTDIRGPWLTSFPLVYMNEFPERRALLGEIRWFSIIANIRSGALLNTGSLLAVGNTELGTFKAVVPWFTGSIPGIYGSRLGQSR